VFEPQCTRVVLVQNNTVKFVQITREQISQESSVTEPSHQIFKPLSTTMSELELEPQCTGTVRHNKAKFVQIVPARANISRTLGHIK